MTSRLQPSEEEGREAALCLLNMLLPYQLRLDALKGASPEVAELSEDFALFLTQLRDELLGG